jgi:hypothetical protein
VLLETAFDEAWLPLKSTGNKTVKPDEFSRRAGWPTGRKPRHPVSNAVARADILRCPEVVADQAAVQKDVEADLWVRVSAV